MPIVFQTSLEIISSSIGFSPKSDKFDHVCGYQRSLKKLEVNGRNSFNGRSHGLRKVIAAQLKSSISKNVNGSARKRSVSVEGDSIMTLTAMASAALAAEKQDECKARIGLESSVPVDAFRLGRLIEGNLLYRQTYVIRSYEVGADKTTSIETLMNLLQETALNHVWAVGLAGDGFGATHEMSRRNLIWVVARMQVQIDSYPLWCDVVEVDTWAAASGKNGMKRDWFVRDYKTGRILARATSTWVMMNRETRKLSKIPDAVKEEIQPYFLERTAIVAHDTKKLYKLDECTAQHIKSELTPKRSDLDVNQHVNNVKYVGWILESVPLHILENNELVNMTLEYKRECGQTHVLQSLTHLQSEFADINSTSKNISQLQLMHLLRMQRAGSEIVRARTDWRPKVEEKSTVLFA